MVDIQRQKEEDRLWKGLKKFAIMMILATVILLLVHMFIPSNIVNIPWLIGLYPFIYSLMWGLIMGSLIMYGEHTIGGPIHHILKQILDTGAVPISASITDIVIISMSLVFADQFKKILEKISNTTITVSLLQQLVGFILGRTIVILFTLYWIQKTEQDVYF